MDRVACGILNGCTLVLPFVDGEMIMRKNLMCAGQCLMGNAFMKCPNDCVCPTREVTLCFLFSFFLKLDGK